jgi:hypothetical protein
MPLLFTTPTGEVFELTSEELPTGLKHTVFTADENNEATSRTSVTELELSLLPEQAGPSPLDGSADASTAPPAQTSTPRGPHRLCCRSASPLIEILTPDELLRKNSPDSPPTPTSPGKPGRCDGSKPRSFVKAAMAYDEYGELVEESKLRHHPTPNELSVTQLLRAIRKKFHHQVNTGP